MILRKLAVEWTGSYAYGGDLSARMPTVAFDCRLATSWLGRLSGEIVDGAGGVPEPATIAGRVRGRRVTFEKRHAHFWIDDGGELKPLKDASVPPIRYVGEVTDGGRVVAGTWTFLEYHRPIGDTMCRFPEIGGTWTMVAKAAG